MPTATQRPSSGINRSQLRSAPMPAPAASVRLASPATLATGPSALREGLQIVGGVLAVLAGLALLMTVIFLISDSTAVGKHLAASKAQRGTLICQGGRMVHGDGTLRDRLMEDAYFVCTDWRTLQSVEQSEQR